QYGTVSTATTAAGRLGLFGQIWLQVVGQENLSCVFDGLLNRRVRTEKQSERYHRHVKQQRHRTRLSSLAPVEAPDVLDGHRLRSQLQRRKRLGEVVLFQVLKDGVIPGF